MTQHAEQKIENDSFWAQYTPTSRKNIPTVTAVIVTVAVTVAAVTVAAVTVAVVVVATLTAVVSLM